MPSLTVRDIPDTVMERLRQAAHEERRSVNAQVNHWLEQAARQRMTAKERAQLLREIQEGREAIARRHGLLSDSTDIIRKMRNQRGRAQR